MHTLTIRLCFYRAQFHGVVIDDYPISEEDLREILYRGYVPFSTIQIDISTEEMLSRLLVNNSQFFE